MRGQTAIGDARPADVGAHAPGHARDARPADARPRRILLVDHAPKTLGPVYRLLRAEARPWEVVVAESAEAALVLLETAAFDVVVTELRLPCQDGASLLREARALQPQSVRIVLAEAGEQTAALRTILDAHQFVPRDGEPEALREVIYRACALQALLDAPALRRVVGEVGELPAVPRVYHALTRALGDPNTPLGEVAALVEQDMALAARVLQLVNSAFFGMPQRMTRIEQAVSYLGLNLLRGLVLADEVVSAFEATRMPGLPLAVLQRRGWLAAALARRLLPRAGAAETAFLGALLHDIGHLVIAARLPAEQAAVSAWVRGHRTPRHVAERARLGVTHAELGAYLLGLWDLPSTIVEAVAHHHTPARVAQREFDVLGAVYVASALAHEVAPADDPAWDTKEPLDLDYLATLGIRDQLADWRRTALALAASER